MKRVVVLPIAEATRFPDFEMIARDANLAAFAGNTVPGRTREAYDSDEAFLEAVAQGNADRYTFDTLEEAAIFAKEKLYDLAQVAQKIEDAMLKRAMQRRRPKNDRERMLRIIQRKKKSQTKKVG